MISFWTKLVLNAENAKLSSTVYAAMYCLQEGNQIKSQKLDNVENILCSNGFSGVWYSQSFINPTWLLKALKQNLTIFLLKIGSFKCSQHLKVIVINYTEQISSKETIY